MSIRPITPTMTMMINSEDGYKVLTVIQGPAKRPPVFGEGAV
jgi:hypothetical protein